MRPLAPSVLLAAALACGAAGPASAERAPRCGGFVRQIGRSDVELVVRARQIEVRVHDEVGRPLDVAASAAFATSGRSVRIALSPAGPGLLIGEAPETIVTRSITLRLAFDDGVVGAARFPARRATCATPSIAVDH